MRDQKELINKLRGSEERTWLLVLDACRADILREVTSLGFETVYNGGANCTPEWFSIMFDDKVDGHLFHGGNPIKSIDEGPDYDENEHFAEVPSSTIYRNTREYNIRIPGPEQVNEVVLLHHARGSSTVSERLDDLGYGKSSQHDSYFDFNVVRYMQPHTPYRQLSYPQISNWGPNYERALINMVTSDQESRIDYDKLRNMYIDNLKWALDGALELIKELNGQKIITSDHGECLGDCGLWFHSEGEHDHMVEVPWMVME